MSVGHKDSVATTNSTFGVQKKPQIIGKWMGVSVFQKTGSGLFFGPCARVCQFSELDEHLVFITQ